MREDITELREVAVGDRYIWGDGFYDDKLIIKVQNGEIIFAKFSSTYYTATPREHDDHSTLQAVDVCLEDMLENNFSEFRSMVKSLNKDSIGYSRALKCINRKLESLRKEIAQLEDLIK